MLELIFQGFVEWIYGLVLECWEYFSDVLLDILNMDFSYLQSHVPVVDTIMQVMLAVGWALLLGNLVFQALRSMATGLGFEAEDPKLLFTRTFVFAFLLLASPQICRKALDVTQNIIDLLQIPDAVQVTFLDESAFGGIGAAWILVVIIGIVVMFKVFTLLLEIAERYVILGMLTICAPLAFGVGGSRSTSDIFTGWCRMFASMCFMMVSNVIFFKMLLSVLSFIPTGLDVLPWMVLVLTITKVAKKVDAIITRIGLNPAITGDSLGRSLPGMLTYSIVRAATKSVVKTAAKNAGGGARGASPKSPPGGGSGGGPKTGSPTGGSHYGAGKQHTGQSAGTQNTAQQNHSTSSQQSSATSSGGQTASAAFSSATQSSSAQQESARQASPWAPEQPGTTRPGAGSREKTGSGFGKEASRQSAVPPGTRRASSHVRQPVPGTAGTVGANNKGRPGQRPGAPSGTAGMAAAGASVQSPGQTSRPGATARTGGQFAQTVQSTSREGDVSTAQNASQHQNISVSSPAQGRQRDSGTAGTRYTSRTAKTEAGPVNGMAGNSTPRSQPQAGTASAPPTARQERQPPTGAPSLHGTVESPIRYGRNAAPSSPASPSMRSSASGRQTARQENPAAMGQAAAKAGTVGSVPGGKRQNPSSPQAAGRTQSAPRATLMPNSKKENAAATAQQESVRFPGRQSSRDKKGGADRGEQ